MKSRTATGHKRRISELEDQTGNAWSENKVQNKCLEIIWTDPEFQHLEQ